MKNNIDMKLNDIFLKYNEINEIVIPKRNSKYEFIYLIDELKEFLENNNIKFELNIIRKTDTYNLLILNIIEYNIYIETYIYNI